MKKSLTLMVALAGLSLPAWSLTQTQLDQVAANLDIRYQHLDNRPDAHCDAKRANGSCFKVEISLTAAEGFKSDNWQIYLSHIAPLQSYSSDQLHIEHINGDLHRIMPGKAFTDFKVGESKSLVMRADGWSVSESDALPNYYIVVDGLKPRIIESTRGVIDPQTGLESRPFVAPYRYANKDKNFKRLKNESTAWATAGELYQVNHASQELADAVAGAIIPTPKSVEQSDKTLDLSGGIQVHYNQVKPNTVSAALARLDTFGVTQRKGGVGVYLSTRLGTERSGSYELKVGANRIEITGVDAAGVSNGLQSLASLLSLGHPQIPQLKVVDEPHYEFRGLHLDVARNFRSKALVLKLIDQMAAYKLNKLHLHLADDEGWRLVIPGLPELTDIGSKRCYDPSEDKCLLTQLGSGPFEDTPANGYFTRADYIEILQAASARHIQVIPSLDMPGHARAAVKSMEARYRKFMKQGNKAAAEQYLLSDLQDKTVYESIQFYHDNTINVCMSSSYAFVAKVIDEVKLMHSEAGHPLSRYHIGADETAGAWVKSPKCETFMKANADRVTKFEDLSAYFVEEVADILSKRGIETAAWGDGLMHTDPERMPDLVQGNAWAPLFNNGHNQAHELANRNWQVVVSSPDVTYFDFPYEADPEEHGYYWASRQTNTRKVFEFMPDNLPLHAETRGDNVANPRTAKDDMPMKPGKRFHGLQGHLWSENVRSDRQAQYMLFPRLIALAERAWHKPEWAPDYNYQGGEYGGESQIFNDAMRNKRDQNWNRFATVLAKKEFPKLDRLGVFYRIPTVGATVDNKVLRANVIFPGLQIQYQVDDNPWQPYLGPVEVSGKVKVRALAADGERAGRILNVF